MDCLEINCFEVDRLEIDFLKIKCLKLNCLDTDRLIMNHLSQNELRHGIGSRSGRRPNLFEHLRDRVGVVEQQVLFPENVLDQDPVVRQDDRIRISVNRK
jgi:hypothetical protein